MKNKAYFCFNQHTLCSLTRDHRRKFWFDTIKIKLNLPRTFQKEVPISFYSKKNLLEGQKTSKNTCVKNSVLSTKNDCNFIPVQPYSSKNLCNCCLFVLNIQHDLPETFVGSTSFFQVY